MFFILYFIDAHLDRTILRAAGFTEYYKQRSKIGRKLNSIYFSLFLGFEGLDEKIIKHCNSAPVKNMFYLVDASRPNAKEDLRESFKDLGKNYIIFETEADKETFNSGLLLELYNYYIINKFIIILYYNHY
jgi:hypothetical protein